VFVTLVPVSGIFPLDHFVRAHYAYLPSVAFCILVPMVLRRAYGAAVRKMPHRAARLAFGGGFGVLLAVYGVETAIDNMAWQDSESLYARVLELEPEIPDEVFAHQVMTATANRFAFVHLSVGATLTNTGQCSLAIHHYERARWLTRQRSVRQQAQQLEADCLLAVGEDDRALALYLPLADAPTGDSAAAARVGFLYVKRGDKVAARPHLAKACERGAKPACEALERLDVPAEPARP
jgi:tetratricopeptide (TPR) repeat protein